MPNFSNPFFCLFNARFGFWPSPMWSFSPAFIEGAKGLALRGTVATIIRRHSKCVLRSGEFLRTRSRGLFDRAAAARLMLRRNVQLKEARQKRDRRRQSCPPGRL
jgi:hypothetical protein